MMDEKDFTIPEGVLSDLCSRFIINVPEEERTDLIRVFFQIEIAHWFYLDFYCDSSFSTISTSSCNQLTKSPNFSASNCISPYTNDNNTGSSSNDESNDNIIKRQQAQLMKPCSIRTFAENIFRHCPFLMQHTNQVDDILSKWKVFKHAVPTNGAIVLDESMRNVLLVQGFWAKASWGFPKGKVVEEESEAHCAQREVFEETGYDISDKLKEDQYLEIQINDQTIRLYIITGVSMSENFEPRTRREIKDVKWFSIDELPVHRKDTRTKQTLGYSPNSFFMVIPFLKALKQWIFANSRDNNCLINSNSSTRLYNNNQRPISTINHQRHNSHHNHHNHHHHHNSNHHHSNHSNHQQNGHRNQNTSINKQLSKSNENLSTLNNSNSNSGLNNKKNYNNKSVANNKQAEFERAQSIKQQSNYNHKTQQNEFTEFINIRDAAIANKAKQEKPKTPKDNNNNSMQSFNHNNKLGTNSNSKFKPINNETKNNKNKINNINNQNLLSSNVTLSPATVSFNNKKQFQQQNQKLSHGITNNINNNQNNQIQNHQALTLNLNEHIQSMNRAKKQLEFSGPECWINFKFDLNSLIQDLPPM